MALRGAVKAPLCAAAGPLAEPHPAGPRAAMARLIGPADFAAQPGGTAGTPAPAQKVDLAAPISKSFFIPTDQLALKPDGRNVLCPLKDTTANRCWRQMTARPRDPGAAQPRQFAAPMATSFLVPPNRPWSICGSK